MKEVFNNPSKKGSGGKKWLLEHGYILLEVL